MNFTIVVSAYNRPLSLQRLLKSILLANYGQDKVNLHISIDYEDSKENHKVKQIANEYNWPYGKKVVECHEENLGLRQHIIKCGELTEKYENIILLEDDIFVSPNFYKFAVQATPFFLTNSKISGIALYSPRYNEVAKREFYPLKSNADNYFMQLPCSWGQVWTKNQWKGFKNWYDIAILNEDKLNWSKVPKVISNWSDQSWKKYFALYMVEEQKYFVYPYISFSTNFLDEGVHSNGKSNLLQVPLDIDSRDCNYIFTNLDSKDSVIYDIYHENNSLIQFFEKQLQNQITIDINNTKPIYTRFFLTKAIKGNAIIKVFNDGLIPVELNVINYLEGEGLYLYDKSIEKKIVVFGTGDYAKKVISEHQLDVAYFLDNNESKWGTKFNGKEVKNPNELIEYGNKEDILIIIASSYSKIIKRQLENMGFKNIRHYIVALL